MSSWGKQAHSARLALLIPVLMLASVSAIANPTGAQVANGQVTFSTQGNALTVTNSASAIINWQSFSIGAGETTRFNQPSASSAVLNRVVGANVSSINGQLTSNGKVFLVNPNGVLFGASAQVNTAAFTASTGNISDANFLSGNHGYPGSGSFLNIEGGTLSGPASITSTAIDFGNGSVITGNVTVNTDAASSVTVVPGQVITLGPILQPGITNLTTTNTGVLATGGNINIVGGTITTSPTAPVTGSTPGTVTTAATSPLRAPSPAITTVNSSIIGPQGSVALTTAVVTAGMITHPAVTRIAANSSTVGIVSPTAASTLPASVSTRATATATARGGASVATISLQKREPFF